jgi:succinoglycan biosynthesis protein ExoV
LELYYWRSPAGNFGDDLNLWLWDVLLPGWRQWRPDACLVGVGTVLNTKLLPRDRLKVVIGSGTGFGHAPDVADTAQYDVRCVRGPRTAAALGLPAELALTDPAAMIARLPEFADLRPTGRTIFVPHCHSDLDPDYTWPKICAAAGVDYLSPRGPSRDVIRALGAAKLVVTESMHGAILADAFRVPWIPVSLTPLFNLFKWQDWAESVGVTISITPLPALVRDTRKRASKLGLVRRKSGAAALKAPPGPPGRTLLRWIQREKTSRLLARLAKSEPYLSDGKMLAEKLEQLAAVLDQTARKYAGT